MSAMSFMELCLTPLLFSFLSKHPASESKAGLGCMACWFLPPFASCREQVCPCTVWEGGSPETDLSLCFYRKVRESWGGWGIDVCWGGGPRGQADRLKHQQSWPRTRSIRTREPSAVCKVPHLVTLAHTTIQGWQPHCHSRISETQISGKSKTIWADC